MMREDLIRFLPELILLGTLLVLLLADVFIGARRKAFYPFFAFVGIAAMMMANAGLRHLEAGSLFHGMIGFDPMGRFVKVLFGLAALMTVVLARRSRELEKTDVANFHMLLVATLLGMNLLAVSSNLLMIYLSLEMVSVLSYILTASSPGVRRSSEAALKYVIYGGVASGIMAYGMSLLYGLTGHLGLAEIAMYLKTHDVSRAPLFLSILLMMAGFGYKIAAFPFHMWCPDVYEGAPTPFTAFLSVGPKAAGFAILIRFFVSLAPGDGGNFPDSQGVGWAGMLGVLSMATMTAGNLAALGQQNLKRLLAYSSIAHAGYMLMGFAALNSEALSAILFYLVVYLLMNIGAFLVVIILQNQLGVEDLPGYRGLGRRGGMGTYLAILMTVFLFSLTGLPPLAGFVGKFYLFGAVIRSGLYGLALVGVLNSVVSLYYYVRVIKTMFFEEAPDARPVAFPLFSQSCLVSILGILTLYFGLFWNNLALWVARSTGLYH